MMGKWVLVVCFQVVLWTTQSTETSELCADGSDGSAYLQSHLKASAALQVAGGANASRRLTCSSDPTNIIDTGICKSSPKGGLGKRCTGCTGGGTIPGSHPRFPTGSLLCENEGGSFVCQASSDPFSFKNSNDFLTCRGEQSCKGDWRVSNVGAVCCSVASADGQSCKSVATFSLNTDEMSGCTSDMCCDGYETCDDGTFTGINSFSCRGDDSCQNGVFSFARNLYCSNTSFVSQQSLPYSNVCDSSTFTVTAVGQHCVQCLGYLVCSSSTFTFQQASEVSLYCIGDSACLDATFVLQDNSKINMVCDGNIACTGNAQVTLGGSGAEIQVTCLNGACNGLEIVTNGGKCVCVDDSDNGCDGVSNCTCPGTGCVVDAPSVCSHNDPDTACCAGQSQGDHPDCSQCGCPLPDVPTTTSTSTTTTTSTGGGGGDPHIDTFDGQHYLLLKQGSFSFWHFSGSDAEVMSAKWLKKLPVDFKMYAHYSGHLSYTKGILLLDNSGMQQPRQMLELTSEDCLWRASQPGMAGAGAASWRTIDTPQLLSVPDRDGDKFTAFRFSPSSKGQKMHLGLLMKQRDGTWKNVGTLFVRCKPGYHINMKMAMSSKKEMDRVDGQIASHGHTSAGDDHAFPKASFLHFMNQRVRTDQEFLTPKSWSDLGGSKQAAEYLGDVDEEGPAFLKGCSKQERLEANNTCKKYLGQPPVGTRLLSFENSLRNCVFDVCNGGGEVAAELAAEILYAE